MEKHWTPERKTVCSQMRIAKKYDKKDISRRRQGSYNEIRSMLRSLPSPCDDYNNDTNLLFASDLA